MKNLTQKIIVPMYHDIVAGNVELKPYDVALDVFRQQIDHIAATAADGQGEKPSVILTFDGGYSSWTRDVLDLLQQKKITAYFFICLDRIQQGQITSADVLALHKAGMVIGSHSMSHQNLDTLPENQLRYELEESKGMLEKIIHSPVSYLSLPGGAYNVRVLDAAKQLGYRHVFTSHYGLNEGLGFFVSRIPVQHSTTIAQFKNIAAGRLDTGRLLLEKVKGVINRNVIRGT